MADVRNMAPAGKKASAGVAHAGDGMKLALAFIKDAEESAREAVKAAESMKDKLKKLTKLSTKEHNDFCAHMNEKREAIKAAATAAGKKDLKDYFENGGKDGQVAQSVQVTVSLWIKLSIAASAGWQPDLKKPWAVLSREATEYKTASASGGKPAQETDAQRKAREAKEQEQMVKRTVSAVTNAGILEKQGDTVIVSEKGKSALPDVVAGIMQYATVEEIEAVIARLNTMREAALKVREDAAKAIAKGKKTAKEDKTPEQVKAIIESSVKEGAPGKSLTERANEIVNDKATAKNKRSRAKA